jgi:hypothetical protein
MLPAPQAVPAADPPRYHAYYDIFDRGKSLIPGHDTRWVPQGLAYWPEKDALVISYYDGRHAKNSRLGVIARATGKRIKIVELPEKGHVGGLGISAGSLWVASSGTVSRYTKSALEATANGARLKRAGAFELRASSYAFADRGDLWVGKFASGGATAYHYRLGPKTETPFFDGQTLPTPSKVQGMAIASGNVIWSRSFGRDNDSLLDVRRLSSPTRSVRAIVAPNMAEGLAVAGGELEVLYESASATYADADYRVRTVHHGPLAKLTG